MPLSNAADFPIWLNFAIFIAAGVVVWIGGTRLTVYVDRISQATGLGQAFAGMLLLGVITSLPEVANTITASSTGNPPLAVNNLLGSAAINVFLLAVGDAFIGRDALTSVVASPATLMMCLLCIIVLIFFAAAITTGDVAVAGIGLWGLGLTLLSVAAFWLASGYGNRARWDVTDADDEARDRAEGGAGRSGHLRSLMIKAAAAGAAIFVAGYALSQTGDAIAEQTGIGSGLVGFALIGIATSLPELSTILKALRMRRYELAFGQVLGTNFVNLSLILLADIAFGGGPVINELGAFEVVSALLGAVLVGILMVGLLERRDATIIRMGYDSLAVIVLFLAGLGLLATVN